MTATLAAEGFCVVRAYLEPNQRASLRRACDAVLERVRASFTETGHSTPRITLDVAEAYELFAAPRIVALLPRDVVRLKVVHYYHEQTKKNWDGGWHRDAREVHVRVALEEDTSLEIVRASHVRADAPLRRGARLRFGGWGPEAPETAAAAGPFSRRNAHARAPSALAARSRRRFVARFGCALWLRASVTR